MIRYLTATSAFAFFVFAPAHAEFSKEWNDYARETEEGCDAFESSIRDDNAEAPSPVGRLKFPALPRGAPARPHICMYFRFDLDASGAPENIENAYKGPRNLQHRWLRDAALGVKDWRFDVSADQPGGYKNLYAKIIYRPVRAWTYEGWLSVFQGLNESSLALGKGD